MDGSFLRLLGPQDEENEADASVATSAARSVLGGLPAGYRIPRKGDVNINDLGTLLKESIVAGVTTAMAATSEPAAKKRKRDEEEDNSQMPIMIHVPNHELKDDGHEVIDYVARGLRPFMGK